MTGSVAALVAIAIVTPLSLFAWIGMVYAAGAHPRPRNREQAETLSRLQHARGYQGQTGAHQEQKEEPSRTERRAA